MGTSKLKCFQNGNNWWLGYQGQICSPFWHPNLKSPPGNLYKRLVAICPPQSSQEKVACQHFKPGGEVNHPPFRGHIASPVLKLSFWRFKHSCCSGDKTKHSMDSRQTNDPHATRDCCVGGSRCCLHCLQQKGKKWKVLHLWNSNRFVVDVDAIYTPRFVFLKYILYVRKCMKANAYVHFISSHLLLGR